MAETNDRTEIDALREALQKVEEERKRLDAAYHRLKAQIGSLEGPGSNPPVDCI